MNRKIVCSLVLAVAAGGALANDPAAPKFDFVSTKTVGEVQAEFVAFKKAGVNPWSGLYDPFKNFVSTLSRSDVTAAYVAARAAITALAGEDSGSMWFAGIGQSAPDNSTASAR